MKTFYAVLTTTETEYQYDFVDLPGCVSISKIADEHVPQMHFNARDEADKVLEAWLAENNLPENLRSHEQLLEQYSYAKLSTFKLLEEHEIKAHEDRKKAVWHESGKRRGGTIKNWQLHHLTIPGGEENQKLFAEYNPTAMLDPGPIMFSGTVVDDPAGRWRPGFHMRSSYIVSIDREKGIIETQNTVYRVIEEGGDVLPDLGNDILKIFY